MPENINIPDSNITTELSFRNLILMNMQQLTNFPYIENDFDALTDYELLCLVVKYLNDVISNQNEQNASITRLYNSFLALQDYINDAKDELEDAFNELDTYVRTFFANLDVQEEIDNKLDAMVEDGTLADIITNYLNTKALFCYDNVASLKLDTTLTNGSYVRTLGYHSINDGGSATYKVRNKETEEVANEMNKIAIGEELIADLIDSDYIPEKYGAYGDGVHDDTSVLNFIVSNYNKLQLKKNYLITATINVPANSYIYGSGKITNSTSNVYAFTMNYNSEIKDITIFGNKLGNGITVTQRSANNPNRNIYSNLKVFNCMIGINLNGIGDIVETCVIDSCNEEDNRLTNSCGVYITNTDNFVNDSIILRSDVGLYSTYQFSINNGKILVCNYGMILGSKANDTLPAYPFKRTNTMTCTNPKINNVMVQESKKVNCLFFRTENPKINVISEAAGDGYTSADFVDDNGYPLADVYIEFCRNGDIDVETHVGLAGGSEKYCVYLSNSISVEKSRLNINCDPERTIDYQFKIINTLLTSASSTGLINGVDMFQYANNYLNINNYTLNASTRYTITKKDNFIHASATSDTSLGGNTLILDFDINNTSFGIYSLLTNVNNAGAVDIVVQGSSNGGSSWTILYKDENKTLNNYNFIDTYHIYNGTAYNKVRYYIQPKANGEYSYNLSLQIVQ